MIALSMRSPSQRGSGTTPDRDQRPAAAVYRGRQHLSAKVIPAAVFAQPQMCNALYWIRGARGRAIAWRADATCDCGEFVLGEAGRQPHATTVDMDRRRGTYSGRVKVALPFRAGSG